MGESPTKKPALAGFFVFVGQRGGWCRQVLVPRAGVEPARHALPLRVLAGNYAAIIELPDALARHYYLIVILEVNRRLAGKADPGRVGSALIERLVPRIDGLTAQPVSLGRGSGRASP